jgi:hypothetical protein
MGPHVAAPLERSPDTHTESPCLPGVRPVRLPVMLVGELASACVSVKKPNTVLLPVSLTITQTALQPEDVMVKSSDVLVGISLDEEEEEEGQGESKDYGTVANNKKMVNGGRREHRAA